MNSAALESPIRVVHIVSRLLLLCILSATAVRAQSVAATAATTPPTPGVGHDHINGLQETVDPASGQVSVRLPVPVPEGRGPTLPFAFAYDSSATNYAGETWNEQTQGYYHATWYSTLTPLQFAGWSYTIPNYTYTQITRRLPNSAGVMVPCQEFTGHTFQDPSGGSHNLQLGWIVQASPCNILTLYTQGGDAAVTGGMLQSGNPPAYAPGGIVVSEQDGTIYIPGTGIQYSPTPGDTSFLNTTGQVEDRNGNIVTTSANFGSFFLSSYNVTDSLGRTAVSVSGFGSGVGTVSVSGLSQPYTVTWENIAGLGQGFNATFTPVLGGAPYCSGPSGLGGGQYQGTYDVVQSIALPNGQSYSFSYDYNYGVLNKITYPSGGYVSYSWGLNTQSASVFFPGCAFIYDKPAILHRYVSFDGSTIALQQDFYYSTSWYTTSPNLPYNWQSKQTKVVTTVKTPDGRSTSYTTIYNYSPYSTWNIPSGYDSGPGFPGALATMSNAHADTQIPLESSVVYQDSTGSTLRTVYKGWADPLRLDFEETQLENGLMSATHYTYGTGMQVTEKDEYDYGNNAPGNLLRKTVTNYQSFPPTMAFPPAPWVSISSLPSSVIVYDGSGNKAQETDYAYDGSAVVSPCNGCTLTGHDETNYAPGSTLPRGNSTKKTMWLSVGGTSLVETYTYDETGQRLTETDSNNNTTTYSHLDSYSAGVPPSQTNAFVTKTTYPSTNSVAHIESFSYAYADGKLTISTDQNGNQTQSTYNDPFRRLTEVDYPGGGKTTYSYNDSPYNPSTLSPSLTTAKIINSSTNRTTVVAMDGLGHAVQTRVTTDPDGTDYEETVYDGLGRVYQRSNPHRSSSLSTDGTTTSFYDALGRICLLVPPDGTLPNGYSCASQPNTVSKSYSGNTVTATDQAGHSRRGVSDGLGRVIEVDEPGASPATPGTGSATVSGNEQSIGGTPAASGTGSVTFSGSLQSKITQNAAAGSGSVAFSGTLQSTQVQTQAAAPGTGSVTISGSERSVTINPCNPPAPPCPRTIYDGGPITVTVNGVQMGSGYGETSTPSSIASALASSINGNSSSPVTASASGATVYLTAKTTGPSTNYSLSASSTTGNTQYFSGTSFPVSTSGSTLTGGANASYTTVYDSGVCTITVNSQGDSTSWSGSGTTSSSIASALSSTINGDSGAPVSASTSGSTVSLTAKTTGSGTNYSLSSSCSYDSSHFSSPSFSTSNSGSALTGGQNAVTTYDSGSSTITVNGHPDSVSWSGSGTTTSSIASALASTINADSVASVTASASGATVSLTAKTTGASTNYSLSASSTYDSSHFTSPSFSSSNSGSTLTGGSNGTATVYDTGSVWINVAGFQATANYGQTDTPTSVASGLATTLNGAGSPVTASASGGNITLNAKAAGANTNFTLSGGSSTSQPSSFSQPSFTISVSGSTLTGGTSPTFSLSTPAITTYNYDVLDNLTGVTQSGSHQRTYLYDSLSRLTQATNPESGAVTYKYDSDTNCPAPNPFMGLLVSRVDARGIRTCYQYDSLNRLTQRSYSDGTPTVKYGYDGVAPSGCSLPSLTIDNGIGKRTSMCDAAGAEVWSFDIVTGTGWKTTDARSTEGVTLTTVYQENLDGSTNSISYPGGHVVSYLIGGAGRPLSATDSTGNIGYASNAQYWPSGELAALSDGSSISFNGVLNSRLQPCWIYATTGSALPWQTANICGATAPTGSIIDLKYNYALGSADNGNVAGITNNRDSTRSQTFAYDSLNRLTTAQTTSTYSTSSANCFGESFNYDAWGNLLSVSESSSSYDGCTYEQPQYWTPTTNNQIQSSATCFDSSGNLLTVITYCYDAAGNLLTNTAISFSYDAENHLKSIPMLGISYLYDGDGRRVAKLNSSNQATKLYWYGTGSDPLDETDGTGATNNTAFFEYAFFNGKRIARRDASNNITYYFADQLGTARVLTNGAGSVCYDADFYPFGGERSIISSCNGAYKFTGKERDAESGLDDFEARFYSSLLGRFASVDPLLSSSKASSFLTDPQSWNGYAYVRNNPLNLTDPTGMLWCTNDYKTCISDAAYDWLLDHPDLGYHLFFTHHIDDKLLRDLGLTPAQYQELAQKLAQRGIDPAQLLDSFNEWLGLGKSNCAARGGDCMDALGKAFTAIMLAVASAGFSEEEALAAKGDVLVYRIEKGGKTIYVGITNDFERRMAQHGVTPQEMKKIIEGLTREQARGVEQALLNQARKDGIQLMNKINSIAWKNGRNPIYNRAVAFGEKVLSDIGFKF